MIKKLHTELNSAQQLIYRPSNIRRAFKENGYGEFDDTDLASIHLHNSSCVIVYRDGTEKTIDSSLVQNAYMNFIRREVPFFNYLGPNHRGPLAWKHSPNTFIMLKGFHYQNPLAEKQSLWLNDFDLIYEFEPLRCFLEDITLTPYGEVPQWINTKKAIGHIIKPHDNYCSCGAFQKQVAYLDDLQKELGAWHPICKHLIWFDKYLEYLNARTNLRESLKNFNENNIVAWEYIPNQSNTSQANGIFNLFFTQKGLYAPLEDWKKVPTQMTEYDAWKRLEDIIKNKYLPYHISKATRLKDHV